MLRRLSLAIFLALVGGSLLAAYVQEYKSGIIWPEPPVVTLNEQNVPSDAIVLFDGKDLSAFNGGEKWEIKDGAVTIKGGGVTTKQAFGDMQMHVEFASPEEVKGNGQGRGNSGIYIMGRYELQVLDSFQNPTYFDGQCGSVYKQQPPTVNATKKPGEWQSYDIVFTAPKFDEDGKVKEPAYITVLHNGVLIHNHYALEGSTSYVEPAKYSKHPGKLPIHIQDHGNPVKYRNIWVRENLAPLVGK
ncbi:MAG TPA: DUF1080 domain-containing protein, partial [Pirellulaceae bacterium]|nr:DUF1080 domain-containing protein [Pirellulaceae bacterium]